MSHALHLKDTASSETVIVDYRLIAKNKYSSVKNVIVISAILFNKLEVIMFCTKGYAFRFCSK